MSVWRAFIAGLVVILIGVIDAWVFKGGFGLEWDKALILAGAVWIAGVMVPSPLIQAPPHA